MVALHLQLLHFKVVQHLFLSILHFRVAEHPFLSVLHFKVVEHLFLKSLFQYNYNIFDELVNMFFTLNLIF